MSPIAYPDLDLQIRHPKSEQNFFQNVEMVLPPNPKLTELTGFFSLQQLDLACIFCFSEGCPDREAVGRTGLGPSATVWAELECHTAESAWFMGPERKNYKDHDSLI